LRGVNVTLYSIIALAALAFVAVSMVAAGSETAEQKSGNPEGAKEIQAREARSLIEQRKSDGLVILDVRTAMEFGDGHINGAVNVDYKAEDFREKLSALDTSATYVVYCRSGRRSTEATEIMEEMGFTDIYHLEDGVLGWHKAGLPLTR
jgi:rhodanese-related sulfurtransferase